MLFSLTYRHARCVYSGVGSTQDIHMLLGKGARRTQREAGSNSTRAVSTELRLSNHKTAQGSSCCGTTGWAVSLEHGTQVPSLAPSSGLRIRRCHSCRGGHDCGSDLIPGPGTPCAAGPSKKEKKKKKKKKEKQTKNRELLSWLTGDKPDARP